MTKFFKIGSLAFLIMLAAIAGAFVYSRFDNTSTAEADSLQLDEQEASIRAIAMARPAAVSIVVYDELPAGGKPVAEQEIKGRGTGFIISQEGYIITNKHVIAAASDKGSYRIILNSGKQYYAQLIGKDPIYDLAVLRIFDKDLPFVALGDSRKLKVGSSVIAIGNALGLYQNSATKGIVSGLGRSIIAGDDASGQYEALDNVIQTDAEINPGNSGGPLIDLEGRVIGINVAIDRKGTSIGFAIPVNDARPIIRSILESGRIIRPKLGLRYTMLTPEIALDNDLSRQNGAWINSGKDASDPIVPDGPADKAGLLAGDIVFEVNAIKVENEDTLMSIIQRYRPGERIGLKVQRGAKVLILVVELGEF